MIPLLFIAGYVVGYLMTARLLYIAFDEASEGNTKPGEFGDKGYAAFAAIIWPVVLLFSLLGMIIFRETPRQKGVRKAAERAATEKAAREAAERFDLSMPDIGPRGLELGAFQLEIRPDITEQK